MTKRASVGSRLAKMLRSRPRRRAGLRSRRPMMRVVKAASAPPRRTNQSARPLLHPLPEKTSKPLSSSSDNSKRSCSCSRSANARPHQARARRRAASPAAAAGRTSRSSLPKLLMNRHTKVVRGRSARERDTRRGRSDRPGCRSRRCTDNRARRQNPWNAAVSSCGICRPIRMRP